MLQEVQAQVLALKAQVATLQAGSSQADEHMKRMEAQAAAMHQQLADLQRQLSEADAAAAESSQV